MIRYAIVDNTYRPGHATRLAAGGVDYIQLRAKSISAGSLYDLTKSILHDIAAVPFATTRLLINSRPDIAIAAGAHGVHLTSGPDELTPRQIRHLFASSVPPTPLITSLSCHTLAEVVAAHILGADLILFGPVFEKRVAREFIRDGSGLTLLASAVRAAAGTPILALGGITGENTPACIAAGAAGIAAIRLFA